MTIFVILMLRMLIMGYLDNDRAANPHFTSDAVTKARVTGLKQGV